MERSEARRGGRVLWFFVWGAMALVGGVNTHSPFGILSGRYGFVLGILFAGIASMQLVFGASFLARKESVLAVVVLVLFGVGLVGQRVYVTPPGIDFGAYYVAGKISAEKPPGQLYFNAVSADGRFVLWDAAPGWQETTSQFGVPKALTFIYPPFFAVLMKPLTFFSYGVAYELWNIFAVLVTIASIWMSSNLGGIRLEANMALILLVGLFSFSPFFQELEVGQISSALLFLCTSGVWLCARRWEGSSAFCFALATMIKITPIVVVPLFVIHRRWKWLAVYGCWMVCFTAISVWQAGWPAHQQFLHSVMPSLSCGITTIGNVSVMSFVQELFLGYVPMDWHLSALPPLACIASKLVSFVVFGLLVVRFYFYRWERDLVRHLTLILLLSLSIAPITWMHHYVIALLPFLYLWGRAQGRQRDYLLMATVVAVGSNLTGLTIPFFRNHPVTQLALAGIIPCLTVALVWFRGGERPVGAASLLLTDSHQ
jgi:hypothetical protein